MDASESRTFHIRRLVAEAGGPAEWSRRYGGTRWQQPQVSQWISESNPKSIGTRLARDIEGALRLPHGYLDRSTPSTSAPDQQSQPVRLDPETLAETARTLRERFGGDGSAVCALMEQEPDRFIRAYLLYAAHTQDERTPEMERALLMKIADLTPQGAKKDERGTSVPTEGAFGPGVGEGRKRKA